MSGYKKRVLDLLEQELQAMVKPPTWMLGPQLRTFARAVVALSYYSVISSVPRKGLDVIQSRIPPGMDSVR